MPSACQIHAHRDLEGTLLAPSLPTLLQRWQRRRISPGSSSKASWEPHGKLPVSSFPELIICSKPWGCETWGGSGISRLVQPLPLLGEPGLVPKSLAPNPPGAAAGSGAEPDGSWAVGHWCDELGWALLAGTWPLVQARLEGCRWGWGPHHQHSAG